MKEYKFRGLDKIHNKMFNIDVLALSECTWSCPDYGKRGVSIPYQPSIEIMQYTGLKDKNGKEIYENDIVKYCFDWTYCEPEFGLPTYCEIKIVGIIKITLNGIKVKILNQEHREEGEEELSENIIRSKYINFRKKTKDVEIIGNIYENPELLKEDVCSIKIFTQRHSG